MRKLLFKFYLILGMLTISGLGLLGLPLSPFRQGIY